MSVKRYQMQESAFGPFVPYKDFFKLESDYAALLARHNALRGAAKGLLAIHKRHKCLTVYSEQDYRDIWSERVDALTALVGEE